MNKNIKSPLIISGFQDSGKAPKLSCKFYKKKKQFPHRLSFIQDFPPEST